MARPLVLMILDGWGWRAERRDNGILAAHTPVFDRLWQNYPHTLIDGSGESVGLPGGIMGNSEVGHMNLGAGRVVHTGLSQIYQAIAAGSLFVNPILVRAMQVGKERALHLLGLVSDGAVHSHQDHLYALLKMAKKMAVREVWIHVITDGRDTSPQSGRDYVKQLEEKIADIGVGKIATISGRFYAMDRDKRWERVQLAYDNMVLKAPARTAASASEVFNQAYLDTSETSDEFIKPVSLVDSVGQPLGRVRSGDAVIFFNFRADRAREITQAFTQKDFSGFERRQWPTGLEFVCMTPYDDSFNLPVAFKPTYPKKIFAEVVSTHGLKQLRIAETEKYAHVTFFFNGGLDCVYPGENRVLIPSPREVPTYDLKPEMSAEQVTERLLDELDTNSPDVVILNYANADMVGHTAVPAAIIKAVETVDACIGKVVERVLAVGGEVLITADHGNAEEMRDESGRPHTAHTTNLVPLILVSERCKKVGLKKTGGRLCDVAPTMLELLALPQPPEMTGVSLIEK